MDFVSQNIEIEFKNILTKDEFNRLMENFQVKQADFIQQENHYFDTPDFALKNSRSALRVRFKKGKYEMTLKQPYGEDLLETNQQLTNEQAKVMLQTGKIPNGIIQELLNQLTIKRDDLQYFGALVTDRVELKFGNGLLVLDHSYYLNHEDYEVEYEVSNRKKGFKEFMKLLDDFCIPIRKTENKIKRFYNKKYKQNK